MKLRMIDPSEFSQMEKRSY